MRVSARPGSRPESRVGDALDQVDLALVAEQIRAKLGGKSYTTARSARTSPGSGDRLPPAVDGRRGGHVDALARAGAHAGALARLGPPPHPVGRLGPVVQGEVERRPV